MTRFCQLLLVLLCCTVSVVGAVQRVDSVRMSKNLDGIRVVFDLQGPVEHSVDKLSNPDRIVIDMTDLELAFDVAQLDFSGSPVKQVRAGRHDNNSRVVFDLSAPLRPVTRMFSPQADNGWRLVVDLLDDLDPPDATGQRQPAPLKAAANIRPVIIALDPGHGGQDPGAIGPAGTREKDIVLQIARRLEKHINAHPGMRAVLVRSGDYYVPLAERRRIAADKHGADVFISIHADAFTDNRAHGASVFALSERGATSAMASYLAVIANDSDRIAGVLEQERQNSTLMTVIADMTTSGTLSESRKLGRVLLSELATVTRLHGNRREVEQANFAVLRESSMLSVLLETGFISNRREEKNLRSSVHQEKMAKAVTKALDKYFSNHPQPETWYAEQRRRQRGKRPATHEISRGETLSSIARRYQVPEASLKQHNNLRSDRIRAGQVLKIPPG